MFSPYCLLNIGSIRRLLFPPRSVAFSSQRRLSDRERQKMASDSADDAQGSCAGSTISKIWWGGAEGDNDKDAVGVLPFASGVE